MLGSNTFCCVCKNPMRSCVIPAVCGSCHVEEMLEKERKRVDEPIIVKAAKDIGSAALESGASEEEINRSM